MLKPVSQAWLCFAGFVVVSSALMNRNAQKMALDDPGRPALGISQGRELSALSDRPSPTHSSTPHRAGIFVSITHVSFKAFLVNVRKLN